MGIYEDFKHEIKTSMHKSQTKENVVNWDLLLKEMKSTIVENYKNEPLASYHGAWKQAFKDSAQVLNLTLKIPRNSNSWKKLIETQFGRNESENPLPTTTFKKGNTSQKNSESPGSSSSSGISATRRNSTSCRSSTSSLQYQKKLNSKDIVLVDKIYKKINKKWVLSSGRKVEEVMHQACRLFKVQHPSHSVILDVDDITWDDYLTENEKAEIRNCRDHSFSQPLPSALSEALMRLNGKKTFDEVYNEIDKIHAHPIKDRDMFWLKDSITNYLMLFYNNTTMPTIRSEQDLLDDVYGFIKKSKILNETTTETGTESTASAESVNSNRSLGSTSKINRKQAADHADLVFKYLSDELACVEVGLQDHGSKGTKELNELRMKSPTMLKNFCLNIMNGYNMESENLKFPAIIISGMSISAIIMTFDKGSVSLVSTSRRYRMPESVAEIPRLLPPVLKLVYNWAKVINDTSQNIRNVGSTVCLDVEKAYFPPCFVPEISSAGKRKSEDISE